MTAEIKDNRFMEFRLGNQLFAIPLLEVKEVIQKPEVTQVPNMPAHFEGMMNLRGQILGVYNVRKKLGASAREKAEATAEVVVVIESAGVNVGMLVDEVTRVLHAAGDMILPAPLKENDPAREYVTSVIKTGEDLILAVDAGQLLELAKHRNEKKAA